MTWLAFALACAQPEVPPPVGFGACAVPAGGFTDGRPPGRLDVALDGPALDQGSGEPPEDCARLAAFQSTGALDWSGSSWFTAADADGTPWTLGVALPAGADLPMGATTLFTFEEVEWGSEVGSVEIRDPSGELLVWMEAGGLPHLLAPPDGLSLERGEEVATEETYCGEVAYFDLVAGNGGQTADVPYGGHADLDGLSVWHGGCDQPQGHSGCSDGPGPWVAAALTPAP